MDIVDLLVSMRVTRRIDQGRSRKWKFGGSAHRWKPYFCLPERRDGHASGRDPQPVDRKETRQIDTRQRCQTTLMPEIGETGNQPRSQYQTRSSTEARAIREPRHFLPLTRVITRDGRIGPPRRVEMRVQTTYGQMRGAEHLLKHGGRHSSEAMGTACPRDRHPHGRRQPWLASCAA